jgi:ferredoxin
MPRSSTYITTIVAAYSAAAALHTSNAFVLPSVATTTNMQSSSCVTQSTTFYTMSTATTTTTSTTSLLMSSSSSSATSSTNILSLQLEKPLGLILEEADSTITNSGVVVTQVNEGGSAYASPSANKLTNAKISKVMGTDVSSMSFDDVMDVIIGAPSPLEIEFALDASVVVGVESQAASTEEEAAATTTTQYEIGTIVSIKVEQPDKPSITLEAKVGDNLRKTLLANKDIELYRGLKKKLGNCGGGGQCGFCAVELTDDSEGNVWGERSEYEDTKIGKKVGTEGHRLACMNNIVGPATVKTL